MTTYQDAGVHLSLGDKASEIMYEAARETWKNRAGLLGEVIVPFDDFSGLRTIDVSNLPKGTLMNIGFDGIGTKVEIAERVGDHSTMAFDLFAMVCDDAVIRGAEPVLIGSILDLNTLGDDQRDHIDVIRQLADGYVKAAADAGVAVVNGEVAELGLRVGGVGDFCCNWGAAVVWFAKREHILTGEDVRPGDTIVGLREEGFRSNGLSLLRKAMSDLHGDVWHTLPFEGKTMGEWALWPSRIYSRTVVDMVGGFEKGARAKVHAAAHITGGGVPGKLGRALKKSGYGARLDDLFTPSPLMLYCQEHAGIADKEAYRTWNMGQGMALVTPEPDVVLDIAKEHGVEAKVIGSVQEQATIDIKSKGFASPDKWFSFGLDE